MPEDNTVATEDKAVEPAKKASEPKTAGDAGIGESRSTNFPVYFAWGFGAIMMLIALFGNFRSWDNSWRDMMFQFRGMSQADKRVVIVAIDDEFLQEIGTFPIPRHHYVPIIENLFKAGVKTVALDIMFLEKSNPKDDAALLKVSEKYADRLIHSIMGDTANLEWKTQALITWLYPFKALNEKTKLYGLVNPLLIDHDGTVREVALLAGREGGNRLNWTTDENRVPSLGLAALASYLNKTPDEIVRDAGVNEFELNLRGEEAPEVEYTDDGQAYEQPGQTAFLRISALDIYDNELMEEEEEALKDAVVLVGSTALGWHDHYPTAFNGKTPGVLVHANMIDNVLNKRWLRKVTAATTFTLIPLFIFLAFRFVSLPALQASAAFAAVLVGWIVFNYIAFLNYYLIEFWTPLIALVSTFSVLLIHKTMLEQQQKAQVRAMFGQYVAPEVVAILVKNPEQLTLGGVKRDMTILFLDIAHFTSISEKMSPESLINFLNRFLTPLSDNILDRKGVVDKYIGDCIMAFWNAPIDVEGHRAKACLAALECIKTVDELNKTPDPHLDEPVAVRIGLNSGEVVVGNTGSARKLAYTVLGDNVNLSSRLEGANKFFGSTIMVSEDTYDEESQALVEARELGKVRVVGKEIPIKVFELLAKKGELSEEWSKVLPIYHEGVALYNDRKFEDAKARFEEVLKQKPDDKPTKLYLNVCDDYIVIPPSPDLELVFNLTSK